MKIVRDIIVPLVVALVISALFQMTVASFKVYGSSMLPTIRPSDYIMVSKAAYYLNSPEHGEVIVFHSPRAPDTNLIKRIIAIPGDTVEIKHGKVFVNGTPQAESYIAQPPRYTLRREPIPAEHYFVLGDNRNNSSDSHTGWTVPRKNIVGKAWITYWPPHRWNVVEHQSLNPGEQVLKLRPHLLTVVPMELPCPTR